MAKVCPLFLKSVAFFNDLQEGVCIDPIVEVHPIEENHLFHFIVGNPQGTKGILHRVGRLRCAKANPIGFDVDLLRVRQFFELPHGSFEGTQVLIEQSWRREAIEKVDGLVSLDEIGENPNHPALPPNFANQTMRRKTVYRNRIRGKDGCTGSLNKLCRRFFW